jgi:hypothetical protein
MLPLSHLLYKYHSLLQIVRLILSQFASDSQINTIMVHAVCNLNLLKWLHSTEEKSEGELTN